MMYLLAVDVLGHNDLLTNALAETMTGSQREPRDIKLVHIDDKPEHAATIRERSVVPAHVHASGEVIEIEERNILGIVVSSQALTNPTGVVRALNMSAIPHRWEAERAGLKSLA